jgi:UDP-N-acetylmuramate dehydrogenase
MNVKLSAPPIAEMRSEFGQALRENESLARFTSARIGGPAQALIEVKDLDQLAKTADWLWRKGLSFIVFGGGSNLLVSDKGVQDVVVLNHAKSVKHHENKKGPVVWAESGANLGVIARQSAANAMSSLEWAAGIPGSIGGAVLGNAGAHGEDISQVLIMADILHRNKGRQTLSAKDLAFDYRTSFLKSHREELVILAVEIQLSDGVEAKIREEMDSFLAYRRLTQPPGASMGSMFKNPSGDHAGRLIEAAGLKGHQIGDAQISSLHANFFLNLGGAKAKDVFALISMAQEEVAKQFGVNLELEIALVGNWN